MTTVRRLPLALFLLALALATARAEEGDPPWRLTLWKAGDPGTPLELRGRVTGPDGRPLHGAAVRIRHADPSGMYTEHAGEMVTGAEGEYVLRTAFPGSYGRPRHIHMAVQHPAHSPLYTEVLFKGDPILAGQDPPNAIVLEEVRLGEKRALVGQFDVVLGAE